MMDIKTLLEDEIDILYTTLDRLKIYDIRLSHTKDGRIFAKDADSQWTGKNFYKFLLNDAIVYNQDGTSSVLTEHTLTSLRQLGKHYGAAFPFMELEENPIKYAEMSMEQNYNMIDGMHDFDTSMFFRWIFKSAFAILIVSNTWNIVMGVFDATQSVVNQSSGVIIGETSIHFDRLIPGLEFQLESMTIGSLLSLWFQTLVVGLTMNILSICIFLVTYGRMIEIYVVTALGPIPLATMGSSEWRSTGQNYLKSLLALGFQAFLIMIVVGIYAVLIRNISGAADIAGAIWGCMGYTVLLCFCLFKTGSISKSVFGAH